MKHTLKLLKEFAELKLQELKPFEIRKDDRNFCVGDLIVYVVPDDEELSKVFKNRIYRIEYITNYAQKEGYVVFTDKLLFW